jgi:hypothetical protein
MAYPGLALLHTMDFSLRRVVRSGRVHLFKSPLPQIQTPSIKGTVIQGVKES